MGKKDYKYDIYRYYGRYKESIIERIKRPIGLKYTILFRKYNSTHNSLIRFYYKCRLHSLQKKSFIQIPTTTKIGKGFYIGHSGSVIINPGSIIGSNCNIASGVTIGQENRGKRKGTPTIGDSVWIGTNSVIVGTIKIGNNVLVAPLAYVNFDVPDNSIVIGSPGKIISNDKATSDYINNKV